MQRRAFLKTVGTSVAAALLPCTSHPTSSKTSLRYLRPPGALPEKEFLNHCIHCGQCGEACPNRCINYFGLENGIASVDTPYIVPREKACILCMKCGEVCPSGAIQEIIREAEAIVEQVNMGHAVVDEKLCLSYQGKTCGVCYRACPLPDIAIRIGMLEQPHVLEGCVGCGLCERSCIQMPHAIRIVPNRSAV